MRDLTGGRTSVPAEGVTIRQIVAHLETVYPGIRRRIVDEEENRVRPNIAVMIDGRMGRMGLLEKVGPDSEIHFVPAISGGQEVRSTTP